MQLYTIDAGYFKLDGGAMFGVVPKVLWQKLIPADENNLCSWSMRCLLIEDGNRLMLVDTGMGSKQDAKFQGFYYRHGEGDLVKSIEKAGFGAHEVTDVIFSHLHFDHCGGGVKWNTDRTKFELTFPNAKYWTHSEHWHLATHPNSREKATFLKENIMPVQEAGQLFFSDKMEQPFGQHVQPVYASGHTEKMTMLKINHQQKTVVFMADTIPSYAHLPLPYVMGYDVRPLQTMQEKETLLQEALEHNYVLFFDHDPTADCCTVEMTEKGIRLKDKGLLSHFL
ncbi:MAG: MBL fold metallo-hydrolase [Runella slithyformis]|nr:MAG: MBL fold metallo-hydrolase [Runella slithyformis]TAE98603.1 MAG: MBL fold metallo-hydrolase [Runella slithyformis]TAF24410.1 MAG: MBL fold metallo-hydrolase [Runella slithyformis]TAF49377.1 MAG: MBL fold metallo-hydrolase [Runella slithyformis]TAF79199.1 MAG: MBL fold metallo-hydrolase [Runella slithyformis]